jgi:hypothetical protein
MYPHTKFLADLLHEERAPPPDLGDQAVRMPQDDPRVYTMQLKKKRMSGLLKTMLKDAGYGDLSRMTTFHNERLENRE